jgi:predicted nucleic acid-binding protein
VIVVDSSVWIDHLNDSRTPRVVLLRQVIGRELILVGDLILLEVLQGLRSDTEATRVERALRRFEVVSLLDAARAPRAAANYRTLRARGITVRKTVDLIIGTFCIDENHTLLHDDRDFDPMEAHLGLRTLTTMPGSV